MRIRFREWLSGATITVLLAIGLVAVPAAAAAGQADSDNEKAARVVQAAAPPIEWSEPRPSPLSLRLFGGFNRTEAGDMNDALDGYYEIFELYEALGFGTTTGGFKPLRDGYNAGADLVLQITPRIGIGIGAGYLRFAESSRITWSLETSGVNYSNTSTLSAVPVRLGLFLTLPLAGRLDLTAGAGVTAFVNLRLDDERHIENASGPWEDMRLSARRTRPFDQLGWHGSVGFEFRISRNTGFFVEALGRYARLKNFDTASLSGKDESGALGPIEGRLYLRTYKDAETEYSFYSVEETPPVSDHPNVSYKEPAIDISGISLQAGFRIRL